MKSSIVVGCKWGGFVNNHTRVIVWDMNQRVIGVVVVPKKKVGSGLVFWLGAHRGVYISNTTVGNYSRMLVIPDLTIPHDRHS